MSKIVTLTAERLREVLRYEPDTGRWTWLQSIAARAQKGNRAGSLTTNGRQISIDGCRFKSSRLAWFYMTGVWPSVHIDHRDLDNSNDRWSNLREATNAENGRNARKHKNNTSGLKGVTLDTMTQQWRAQIMVDRKQVYLGLFDCPAAAHLTYVVASAKLHGEFGRVE